MLLPEVAMNYRKFVLKEVAFLAIISMLSCSAKMETPGKKGANVSDLSPTAEWVMACRAGDTGFGCYPGDSAFTSRTGMALETLEKLGELDKLQKKEELISWLKSRQQKDGGFVEFHDYYNGKEISGGSQSMLEATFWALRSLELLGAQSDNQAAAKAYILSKLHENGGYDAYEYAFGASPEGLYSTLWALGALKILGGELPEASKTRDWVIDMGNTKGGLGGYSLGNGNWKYSSVAGCYYALRCLDILGGKTPKPDSIRAFLFSDYGQEPDGGFEVGHNKGWRQNHYSRMEDTYYGVYALKLLGHPLSDLDSSRAKRPRSDCIVWISSVQNPDGGFGRFGISENTPLPSPSEMRATWQAVCALTMLDAHVPDPLNHVTPVNEIQVHMPKYRHPNVDCDDPADVWAYRRIALPIYEHFYQATGSKMAALGRVNRWASAAIGPHNGCWLTQGRGILMHGWGQCGTMSWLFQDLVTSIDFAARGSFIIADVNCEVLVQEDSWDKAHWCLYVPFTHEYPLVDIPTPEGKKNGWSVLDMAIDYRLRKEDPSRPRPTRIADRLFKDVKVEMIDPVTGEFGEMLPMDSTTTYDSPVAAKLYPGGSY